MSEVITVRVPRRTKEKLRKYNVDVSATLRKAIEDCLNEIEQKELEEKLEQAKKIGEKIDTQLFVRLIREDRESH